MCIFFFRQKTAYDVHERLVGSELCIRDRVEAILRSHPDIEDVAVVGRPRADGSEDVVACVTLTDGSALDPEGLKAYARERLTRYKVPRDFYHFEQLQRDQTGKIRRREVRDTLLTLLTQP